MNSDSQSLNVALQVLIKKARDAGGEPAVRAVLDRLQANYSLLKNNGSNKKH
ncbi:hypothetical protein RE069_004043 [Klebsiella aerogenes]|nr:hypothetical protein [Klebsiella aerogenes]